MLLGVPRDVRLTSAKETFLLDGRAAGMSPKTLCLYRSILEGFIKSVGDMKVRELGSEHVRLYIADLADHYHLGRKTSSRLLMQHYSIVRYWIRWLYAQKMIEQRTPEPQSPRRFQPGRLVACRGYSWELCSRSASCLACSASNRAATSAVSSTNALRLTAMKCSAWAT